METQNRREKLLTQQGAKTQKHLSLLKFFQCLSILLYVLYIHRAITLSLCTCSQTHTQVTITTIFVINTYQNGGKKKKKKHLAKETEGKLNCKIEEAGKLHVAFVYVLLNDLQFSVVIYRVLVTHAWCVRERVSMFVYTVYSVNLFVSAVYIKSWCNSLLINQVHFTKTQSLTIFLT